MFKKKAIRTMTDDIIDEICLHGNENNRHRACQLVKSGSVQHSTLQCTKVLSRLDNNLDMLLLKVSATLSMKSKVVNEIKRSESDQLDECCAVRLAFDLLSKDFFIPMSCV